MSLLASWILLLCLGADGDSPAQLPDTTSRDVAVWIDRLLQAESDVWSDETVESSEKGFSSLKSSFTLASSNRPDLAISLARKRLVDYQFVNATRLISSIQAEHGDLVGALRTAALHTDRTDIERTRRLVAIRLAQRGDFTRASDMIDELTTAEHRDDARHYLARELLKRKRYHDCLRHYGLIQDDSVRRSTRDLMRRERRRLPVDHPDFVERSVELAKQARALFFPLSDHQALVIRLTCKAEVALDQASRAEYESVVQEAKRRLGELELRDKCNLLFGLGTVGAEFQEAATARELFAEVFELLYARDEEDEEPPFLPPGTDFGPAAHWRAVAIVMTPEELKQIAERMRTFTFGNHYLNALGGGLGLAEKYDIASDLFSGITSPKDRLEFCLFFLDGLAQRAKSLRKEPEWTPNEQDAASLTILDQILEGNPPPEFDFREDEKN
jgi:hypothetical protein